MIKRETVTSLLAGLLVGAVCISHVVAGDGFGFGPAQGGGGGGGGWDGSTSIAATNSISVSGDGAQVMEGWKRRVYTYTGGSGAPTTLTAAQSGSVVSNEGATDQVYVVLPTASAGLRFWFVVQDADGIRATAASGDTIRVVSLVSATAGYTQSTTMGSAILLEAINSTEWVAFAAVGTWSVDS